MKKKIIAGLIILSSVGSTIAGCGLGSTTGNISKDGEELFSAVSEEASKDIEQLQTEIDMINGSNKETDSSTADTLLSGILPNEFDDGKIKIFEFPGRYEPEVLNVKEEILGQDGNLIDLNNEPIKNNALGQKIIYKMDEKNRSLTLYNGSTKKLEDFEKNNKLDKRLGYTNVEGESVIWYLVKEANIENSKITLKGYDTGFNEKYSIELKTLFSRTDVEIDPDEIIRKCKVHGNDYKKEDNSVIYISVYGGDNFYPIDLKQNKLLSYKGYFTDNDKFIIDGSVGYDIQNDIYGDVDKDIIYNADGSVKADLSEYDFQSFYYIPYCDLYVLNNADKDGNTFVTGDGKKADLSLFGPKAKTVSLVKGYNKNKIFMVEYENNDGDKLYGFSGFDGETIIEPESSEAAPEAYIIGDYLSYGSNVYNVSTKKNVNDKNAFSLLGGELWEELYFESEKHIFFIDTFHSGTLETKPARLIVIEK